MKIHIFGASASGVTTLGRALAAELNIPYFDTDSYFWEQTVLPFTVKREPTLRNTLLSNDLIPHPNWILGGSIVSWGQQEWMQFDLVVFLYIPHSIRMARLHHRELERYGNQIFEDPIRRQLYHDFVTWASGYDDNSTKGRTLAVHEAWLQQQSYPILELRGDLSVVQRIEAVKHKLSLIS